MKITKFFKGKIRKLITNTNQAKTRKSKKRLATRIFFARTSNEVLKKSPKSKDCAEIRLSCMKNLKWKWTKLPGKQFSGEIKRDSFSWMIEINKESVVRKSMH